MAIDQNLVNAMLDNLKTAISRMENMVSVPQIIDLQVVLNQRLKIQLSYVVRN